MARMVPEIVARQILMLRVDGRAFFVVASPGLVVRVSWAVSLLYSRRCVDEIIRYESNRAEKVGGWVLCFKATIAKQESFAELTF